MPRQKKDAKILNIKLAREISNQLEQFCEESGISKTVANFIINKRCQKYTEKYFESKKKVDKYQCLPKKGMVSE